MSLINDALRRAKQAQQENSAPPVAPVPQLRPVEPTPQAARHGLGVMLPCSLAAIALMSLLLYWEISKRDASVVTAQARTLGQIDDKNPSAPNAGAQTASASTPADPSVSSATQASTPSPAGRSVSEPNASVKESAAVAGSQPSSAMAEAADTNRPAAVEPPSPPPLKLQSIVYNPRRPSAMINGRILFVGDRVSEYRVVTIHADNVLLAGAGHTNLLSLDP